MIVAIDWQTFHVRYFNTETIYVKETDTHWILYTTDGHFNIKCEVIKSDNQEENIMFVERYFADRQNLIKAVDIYEEKEVVEGEDEVEIMPEEESFGGTDGND